MILCLGGGKQMSYFLSSQSAGIVEYSNCIFAESPYPLNACPWYDTTPSDDETPVLDL